MLTDQSTFDVPSPGVRPMSRAARPVGPVEYAPAGVSFLTSTAPAFVPVFVFGAAVDADTDVEGGVPSS